MKKGETQSGINQEKAACQNGQAQVPQTPEVQSSQEQVRRCSANAASLAALASVLLLAGCAAKAYRIEPPPPIDVGDGGFSVALASYARGLLLDAAGTAAAEAAALEAYATAHRLDPTAAQPFMRTLVAMLQAGQSNEVEVITGKNARLLKDNVAAWAIHGSVAEANGHYREAALAYARSHTLQMPDGHDEAVAEIRNWFMAGEDGRAIRGLHWLVAQTNLSSQYNDAPLQWARHFILKERKPQRALPVIDLMEKSATNDVDKAAALTFRGDAEMLTGATNRAVRTFWRALEVMPAHNPAVQRLGRYYAAHGGTNYLERGEARLERERAPLDRVLVYAVAWSILGKEDRAASVLLAGRNAALRRKIVPSVGFDLALGAVLDEQERYAQAAEVFLNALRTYDDAHLIMNHLAYMWAVNNERLDEALQWSEKALSHEPHNYAYIDTLGWIYFRQGRYYDALNQLLLSARLAPGDDGVILDHIGDALAALERHAEAVSFWKRAQTIATDGQLSEIKEKIARSLRLLKE